MVAQHTWSTSSLMTCAGLHLFQQAQASTGKQFLDAVSALYWVTPATWLKLGVQKGLTCPGQDAVEEKLPRGTCHESASKIATLNNACVYCDRQVVCMKATTWYLSTLKLPARLLAAILEALAQCRWQPINLRWVSYDAMKTSCQGSGQDIPPVSPARPAFPSTPAASQQPPSAQLHMQSTQSSAIH